MPRLTAGALTPAHQNHLVTISAETGESITLTLDLLEHGYMDATIPAVGIVGNALGQAVRLMLPHWHPVHVFTDDESPTAKARRLEPLDPMHILSPGRARREAGQ